MLKVTGRWTAIGAMAGGSLFLALSLYRSLEAGGPSLSHLNPMGVMTVIGLTVGALVGPLVGAIVGRRRPPRGETDHGST